MNAGVEAFRTVTTILSPVAHSAIHSNSKLGAVPLGDMDPQELSTHVQALNGFLEHQTSLLLSAAATAPSSTMETLENLEATQAAIVQNEGWWAAYLNVFKTTIEFVHSGIDGPIHKLGWEGGTWGFSIAIFTAGKSNRPNSIKH